MKMHPADRLRTAALSRRKMLKAAGGLAVAAALPLPARAEMPKRGGHLRLGIGGAGAGDALNPTRLVGDFIVDLSRQIYNTLVEIDDSGRARPELVESWVSAEKNTRWTFRLRQGVVFHDGKPLTSGDVAYSLGLHMGPKAKSPAKILLKSVESLKTIDSRTFELHLQEPIADFPYYLSDVHFAIVPDGATDWGKAVGTGPYQLKRFLPGEIADTTRNPAYWRSDRAFVDSVTTLAINDDNARLTALQSGAVDIINKLDPRAAKMLASDPRIHVAATEGRQHWTLPMDGSSPPFSDPNVRLAAKYAIDQKAIVDLLLLGYGAVGNDNPVPRSDPFFNKELPLRPYDPDKARFYLKKAGLGSLKTELYAAGAAFTQAIDLATIYQEQARPAGLDITVIRAPNDSYWDDVWLKKTWCTSFWVGRAVCDMLLTTVYQSQSKWNESRWKNDLFDKLLVEARQLDDFDKRKQLYWEAQALIHDDAPTIIPAFAFYVEGLRKNVAGYHANPNNQLSDHRVAERVWLE